jgi:hypothetical protein
MTFPRIATSRGLPTKVNGLKCGEIKSAGTNRVKRSGEITMELKGLMQMLVVKRLLPISNRPLAINHTDHVTGVPGGADGP